MICGPAEIDGYAFCLGLESLNTLLRDINYFVAYTIRRATVRSRSISVTQGRISLDISPLGELLDMYHSHEASKHHDKIYALLGMSSNDLSVAGLKPDYNLPWKKLLKQVIKFLLSDNVSIDTQTDKEAAVINGKGYILGRISSVRSNISTDNSQSVKVSWRNVLERSQKEKEQDGIWTFNGSANPIMNGDLVCLLEGCSRPTIIRVLEDISFIITIAPSPPNHLLKGHRDSFDWLRYMRWKNLPTRDITLIWDWVPSRATLHTSETYRDWVQSRNWSLSNSNTEVEDLLDEAARLWNCAFMLADGRTYKGIGKRLQDAIVSYDKAFRSQSRHSLDGTHGLEGRYDTITECLLLKNKEDRTLVQNYYGWTPLSWALNEGCEAVAMFILGTGEACVNLGIDLARHYYHWQHRTPVLDLSIVLFERRPT